MGLALSSSDFENAVSYCFYFVRMGIFIQVFPALVSGDREAPDFGVLTFKYYEPKLHIASRLIVFLQFLRQRNGTGG